MLTRSPPMGTQLRRVCGSIWNTCAVIFRTGTPRPAISDVYLTAAQFQTRGVPIAGVLRCGRLGAALAEMRRLAAADLKVYYRLIKDILRPNFDMDTVIFHGFCRRVKNRKSKIAQNFVSRANVDVLCAMAIPSDIAAGPFSLQHHHSRLGIRCTATGLPGAVLASNPPGTSKLCCTPPRNCPVAPGRLTAFT